LNEIKLRWFDYLERMNRTKLIRRVTEERVQGNMNIEDDCKNLDDVVR